MLLLRCKVVYPHSRESHKSGFLFLTSFSSTGDRIPVLTGTVFYYVRWRKKVDSCSAKATKLFAVKSSYAGCKSLPAHKNGVDGVLYAEDGYIIFRSGTGYIVHNTRKEFSTGHSHLRGFKPCKDAIFFVRNRKIPKRTNFYYLRTLQRLSEDDKYVEQIEQLIGTRKQKGRKQGYRNRAEK